MKNMRKYASKQKIRQKPVDPQAIVDMVPSFQKAFPGLLEWHQTTVDKLESSK